MTLLPYQRNTVRNDINCPGDTILYNCSVLTNAETVELIWQVTLPNMMPINITFDESSNLFTTYNLDMNISAMVIDYVPDQYIESIITITVLEGLDQNGTELMCRKSDLDREIITVFVNTAGNVE